MIKSLQSILSQVEKLKASRPMVATRLKDERDAFVNDAICSGVFPSLDGLDRHQRAAIAAARRART